MSSAYLRAALRYAGRGWAVFPLRGKRPLPFTQGHLDATTDPDVIKAWWREYPNANIGIACSSVNGPVVLDVDGPEGMRSLKDLDLPSTLKATSGGKARRHYYFSPSGESVRRTIKIRPGLDILGDGGYVVAPPSMHPERRKRYRWLNDNELADIPDELVELAHERTNGNNRKQAPPIPDIIPEGQRDEILTSLAGTMRRRGASEEGILAALREENDRRCRPPLEDRQLQKIARSIARKDPAPRMENFTDLGNARRFVQQHQRDVRHVKTWKNSWLIWDGLRWSPDETGESHRMAKNTVRQMYQEAATIEDLKAREAMLKHAQRSEAASKVRNILDLASTEPEIAMVSDTFDSDPWLLNLENGTLDLRTGEMHAHRRSDLITKLAPVEFDPSAGAPIWMAFLNDITAGNKKLQRYLQSAVGYALTGDVREQVLFFCYGTGQNGKSTFLETLRDMMGEYSQQADFSTLLSKRGDGPRNDLARMRGTRLVTAVEAPADKSFDESVLKQLTGGDTVTARRLYEEFFEFRPSHKLFLAANHKPHVNEMTEAFWRRIRLIPFTVYIPPENRDPQLKEKLSEEMSGILNWALEGCLRWQKKGLEAPKAVERATESYREEEDLIGEFLSSACRMRPKAWTSASDLYQSFTVWWRETRGVHTRPPSPRWFTRSLGERKEIRSTKRAGVRGYRGVALLMELG